MLTRASAPLHIDIDLASTSTTTSHLATAQTAARDATRDGHGDEEMLSEDDEILLATLPELQQRSAEQQVILEQDEDEEQEERGVEAGDDLFDQVVLWDEQGVPYRTVEGQKVELSQEELEARQELAAGWALEDDEARRASEDELDEEEESEEDDDDEMGDSKSEGEIEAINYEMAKLTESVPALLGAYKLVDRLGEGESCSLGVSQLSHLADDVSHIDRNLLLRLQGHRPQACRL